eukprot:15140555-Ditylum_brightwellii.AAC.1
MASTAETENGALFIDTQKREELQLERQEMGHPQPATPVMTDNFTACGAPMANSLCTGHWEMRTRVTTTQSTTQ